MTIKRTTREQRMEIRRLALLRKQIARKIVAARIGLSKQQLFKIETGGSYREEHQEYLRQQRRLSENRQ